MGFGTSASQIVFFIAAIVVSVGVVGSFNTSVSELTGDVHARGDLLANELATDVRIVNDPGEMPNDPVVLYVLNTGTRTLVPNETVVLIDGAVHSAVVFDVLDTSSDSWRAGQVLEITLTGSNLAAGDHRAR